MTTHWIYNPEDAPVSTTGYLDAVKKNRPLEWAGIVLDTIELIGKTKVTSGELSITDIPTFIRNRYEDEINEFILLLAKAKLRKRKETTIS